MQTHVLRVVPLAFLIGLALEATCARIRAEDSRPNIVLMMADDMGFSDLGCYGSEIPTPHLDRLAQSGIAYANFTNTSRCCPSRASLMTGMYSHQVGMGAMTSKGKGSAYQGQLSASIETLPEILGRQGYSTAMVGKWHLTLSKTIDSGPNGSWPLQRGFQKFYGTMEGAKNYFRPKWLFDQQNEVLEFKPGFYYTDAITRRAARWINQQPASKPLFLYTAFYAPHFPLQAPQQSIEKHLGKYQVGWDELRRLRLQRQKELGLMPNEQLLSERPADVPTWKSLSQEHRDALDLRMATYAAQVELLDAGVGRILDALESTGRSQNTLILFLSDNGAASNGAAFGAGPTDQVGKASAPIVTTYGKGWATLSNTPFRMHKANTHEGGIRAPLIVKKPASIIDQIAPESSIAWSQDMVHIIDIAPTILNVARCNEEASLHMSGIDFLVSNRQVERRGCLDVHKTVLDRGCAWKLR
ncbi:MAG: sulfatase-like hydrolase/transferase, partial [Planctomycetota bacterium]